MHNSVVDELDIENQFHGAVYTRATVRYSQVSQFFRGKFGDFSLLLRDFQFSLLFSIISSNENYERRPSASAKRCIRAVSENFSGGKHFDLLSVRITGSCSGTFREKVRDCRNKCLENFQ